MSLRLYEITGQIRDLLETGWDEETGEMSPALAQSLTEFEDKGAAVAAYALNLDAEADAIKVAIDRLTKSRRTLQARAERMREYLATNMKAAGISKIVADDRSFVAKLELDRDESVEIDLGVVLPNGLCRIKVEPDKVAIKKAILAGEPVPEGVRIVRKDRLTLR